MIAWSRSDSAVTIVAFLPPVSANRFSRGLALQHRQRRLGAAGEDHRIDLRVIDQLAASFAAGARHELQHLLRHARAPEALAQLPRHEHGVGRGLEDDGVARRQRRRDAAAGDGDREIPRRNDHHDALGPRLERGHLLPPAGRVAVELQEVHRFGDLGVGLRRASCRRWPARRPSGRPRALRISCATSPSRSKRVAAIRHGPPAVGIGGGALARPAPRRPRVGLPVASDHDAGPRRIEAIADRPAFQDLLARDDQRDLARPLHRTAASTWRRSPRPIRRSAAARNRCPARSAVASCQLSVASCDGFESAYRDGQPATRWTVGSVH